MRILEAGHYYSAKGPTRWSLLGWEIMLNMRTDGDKSMLFIDNIHSLSDVPKEERELPKLTFNPEADFVVTESAVVPEAWEFLEILKALPQKKRTKVNSGRWYCSGFPLTTSSGAPNCVLLDAGLTLHKRELGFQEAVNILPMFYENEQRQLLRLVAKALPNFRLQVVLYDLAGNSWNI